MNPRYLPRSVVVAVCLLTILPTLFALCGWRFDFSRVEFPDDHFPDRQFDAQLQAYYLLAGPFLHTILEWTAVCVAIVTGLFSFVHYRLKRDVTTPIIGTALFFSGMLDAFNILAADRLTFPVQHLERFIPFTWAVSRMFNVSILLAGTLPFVLRGQQRNSLSRPQEIRSLVLFGLLYGIMAYAIIQIFAVVIEVPVSLYPESRIPRPWDAIPLMFWLLTGLIVLPRFWKQYPSVFAHALLLSVVPALATQLHMAFGSTELFDHHFFSAYFLKILAYGIPLAGMILDYGNVHRADVALRETETKLETARQIANSLLPANPDQVAGLQVAGFSYASEAVGGDYYDFLKLSGNRFGVVVGDVSGHDLAASILASQCRAYLRAYAESLEDLGEVFTRLNNSLVIDTQQRRFITMFAAVVAQDRKTFTFASAGHQGYLLRKSGQVETLSSEFLPLGMMEQKQIHVSSISSLSDGDQLLIVTDGITEAASPAGEQYGLPRVIDFLKTHSTLSVPELLESLKKDVNRFCNDLPPSDDVTVVLVRWQNHEVRNASKKRG